MFLPLSLKNKTKTKKTINKEKNIKQTKCKTFFLKSFDVSSVVHIIYIGFPVPGKCFYNITIFNEIGINKTQKRGKTNKQTNHQSNNKKIATR